MQIVTQLEYNFHIMCTLSHIINRIHWFEAKWTGAVCSSGAAAPVKQRSDNIHALAANSVFPFVVWTELVLSIYTAGTWRQKQPAVCFALWPSRLFASFPFKRVHQLWQVAVNRGLNVPLKYKVTNFIALTPYLRWTARKSSDRRTNKNVSINCWIWMWMLHSPQNKPCQIFQIQLKY